MVWWQWLLTPVLAVVAAFAVRWAAQAFAREVVRSIGVNLGVEELRADLAFVRTEVTLNGGETLKDMVLALHRQVEALLTDH